MPTDQDTSPTTHITDPVMPEDYSTVKTPTSLPPLPNLPSLERPSSTPTSSPPPSPIPSTRPSLVTPPTPQLVPASLPQSKSASGIVIFILSLLAFTGIAASTFFYTQNRKLNQQLSTLESIEAQRTVPEITPTPEITPVSTTSAAPSATPSASMSAFSNLSSILDLAKQEADTAQLLMVTSDNLLASKPVFKYWFRRAPSLKSYFFIQYEMGSPAQLFSSANVTPDNNIPDLIEYHNQNTLGLDIEATHKLALDQVVTVASSGKNPVSVNAKYLRSFSSNPSLNTPVNLWQLSYKFDANAGVPDIIVQVNAQTSEIVFTSLPKEIPTTQ